MKLSLNWLNTYIEGPALEADAVHEALTLLGFEVEGLEQHGLKPSEHLVVGRVLKRDPHPSADRLSVCEVSVGSSQEPRTIVCGAQNYTVGDCVPAALPGTVLPGNIEIKPTKLRGVSSDGMLCSARELGLGQDHEGLLILKNPPAEGTPIHTFLGASDTVFDLEITPNRPDCLSHWGLARDLAAYLQRPLKLPEATLELPTTNPGMTCTIQAPERCTYYSAYVLEGLSVSESPEWLQQRLQAVGLRPINTVVDVTNFVLQETGQPFHAFDAQKLKGDTLAVRYAQEGETLITLEGKERLLQAQDLVIADSQGPVALAGILGGADSQVDDTTKHIVLEVAHFSKKGIRATAHRLDVSTDSSHRFERGVDLGSLEAAAHRAVSLLQELTGARLVGRIQAGSQEHTPPPELPLSTAFIEERCGFPIPEPAIQKSLSALGFGLTPQGSGSWSVRVPSFRQDDVTRPVDLLEEALRLYGTDRIPSADPVCTGLVQPQDPELILETQLRNHLVAQGFSECMNDSFVSREDLQLAQTTPEALQLAALDNPLSQEQTHLRPHNLYGLLKNLKTNLDHGTPCTQLFEIGHAFVPENQKLCEAFGLGFLWVKEPLPAHWHAQTPPDFYAARQLMDQLLSPRKERFETWTAPQGPGLWQPGHTATTRSLSGLYEACVGLLNPTLLKQLGIKALVYAGQLWYRPPAKPRPAKRVQFKKTSAFPCVSKDLSLLIPQQTPAQEVERSLYTMAQKQLAKAASSSKTPFHIESLTLFDVYTGQGLPEGHKSLSFSLQFRSAEGTLTDTAVQEAFNTLVEALPYSLRS